MKYDTPRTWYIWVMMDFRITELSVVSETDTEILCDGDWNSFQKTSSRYLLAPSRKELLKKIDQYLKKQVDVIQHLNVWLTTEKKHSRVR